MDISMAKTVNQHSRQYDELTKIVTSYGESIKAYTLDSLLDEEMPFFLIQYCDDEQFSDFTYEITLAGGGPTVIMYVDNHGHFKICGDSISVRETSVYTGKNPDLLEYFQMVLSFNDKQGD